MSLIHVQKYLILPLFSDNSKHFKPLLLSLFQVAQTTLHWVGQLGKVQYTKNTAPTLQLMEMIPPDLDRGHVHIPWAAMVAGIGQSIWDEVAGSNHCEFPTELIVVVSYKRLKYIYNPGIV